MPISSEWLLWAVSFVLAGSYVWLLRHYRRVWHALPEVVADGHFLPTVRISVLIPARNEATTIRTCLDSLARQTYPGALFDVFVIDDYSTDETACIARTVEGLSVQVLSLADVLSPDAGRVAYKKEALRLGVAASKGALIVCTDADCILPADWLMRMAWAYEKRGWLCITGPVLTLEEKGLLARFQCLDFAGMMLLTAAGIADGNTHLANGAAFAYARTAYDAVHGYEGLTHLASGDDILLLHKIQHRFPGKVGFLKTPEAVLTRAQPNWKALFRQRLRWGTKSGQYQDKKIAMILGLVFLLSWAVLFSLVAMWFYPLFAGGLFVLLAGSKGISDYGLLRDASRYFRRAWWMRSFLPAEGIHVLYIAVVGLASNLLRTYSWKGRRVS
ncbi:MAG: glycosyltransferase [Haliscomenobacter sp.]